MRRVSLFLLIPALLASPAAAWVYPEHRQIAGRAMSDLSPARKEALKSLWEAARRGQEQRLCADPWEGRQEHPACLDLAAWPAISGDHSCSGDDMLSAVLEKKWTLKVAGVTADLEKDLATAKNEIDRRNWLTRSDLRLETVDLDYSTRAGANNAHFLLARETDDVKEYLIGSGRTGAELNALGIWMHEHVAALRLAAEWAAGRIPEADRPRAARAILAAEMYGDHFLEDVFAAGHVAGVWGDVATRLGTHNYYNVEGLDTRDWTGKSSVLFGDAHMQPSDLERAAHAVHLSLGQVLDALDPSWPLAAEVREFPLDWANGLTSFDTCKSMVMPAFHTPVPAGLRETLGTFLKTTPVPGRRPPNGPLPRFRSEIGPFVGLASGISGGTSVGDSDSSVTTNRATGAIDVGARIGVGLEALLGDAGDGQIFLQGGVLQQLNKKSSCDGCTVGGVAAGIALKTPARKAISARLRLPYWLIPGDLLIAAPLLAPFDMPLYKKMAMRAANGGLIPWQAGLSTFFGRVQFVLGREVGVQFYGYSGGEDQVFIVTPGASSNAVTAVSLRSIEFDLPIVEIRPFRGYATQQAAALLIQIGAGWEKATKVTVLAPTNAPVPELKTAGLIYLRLAFDWRYYLGSGREAVK